MKKHPLEPSTSEFRPTTRLNEPPGSAVRRSGCILVHGCSHQTWDVTLHTSHFILTLSGLNLPYSS